MFAEEVQSDKFTILPLIKRNQKSWSSKIVYNDETLKLQTPTMPLAFDLNEYTYPGTDKVNYSITVSLDPTINGVPALEKLLKNIDACTQATYAEETKSCKFHHSVYVPKNSKFYNSIRLKMVSNSERFKCTIMVNNKKVSDKISDVKKLLTKGTKGKLLIQLNPIWKVGDKFGVSYQLLGIDVEKINVSFRKEYS